jgi:hypothetical protein
MKDEERGITFGGDKTEGMEKGGEAKEPCPRCLFEAVEGLFEEAHMRGMCRINKPRRLSTIDSLGEFSMQEGIFHVKLVDWPVV